MRPIKAVFLFIYCLAAITAVGTAVSHLWRISKLDREEAIRLTPPSGDTGPSGAQP